ncbi:hypothetical protein FA13DRAFT_1519829 [Coprinellus micaceus]|uniref:Uncharacterized protein n=1 Tax=Coprinellus micaceus TaxID=71717 RepID=A0A4Y7SK68_COPMI|nr:hypothetical protein FA13DRAFT_1519829 [Coprinellus micaceus]
MFVAKFQWESLRLVLTSERPEGEWGEFRYDIVHLSRLCSHLLRAAREAAEADPVDDGGEVWVREGDIEVRASTGKGGYKDERIGQMTKLWRCAMFDRALTRWVSPRGLCFASVRVMCLCSRALGVTCLCSWALGVQFRVRLRLRFRVRVLRREVGSPGGLWFRSVLGRWGCDSLGLHRAVVVVLVFRAGLRCVFWVPSVRFVPLCFRRYTFSDGCGVFFSFSFLGRGVRFGERYGSLLWRRVDAEEGTGGSTRARTRTRMAVGTTGWRWCMRRVPRICVDRYVTWGYTQFYPWIRAPNARRPSLDAWMRRFYGGLLSFVGVEVRSRLLSFAPPSVFYDFLC